MPIFKGVTAMCTKLNNVTHYLPTPGNVFTIFTVVESLVSVLSPQ